MRRQFFIADNLDVVEKIESSLRLQGFSDNQYHVLSHDDVAAEKRRLHDVSSILKQDVVHSAEIGALVGLGFAFIILILAFITGWTKSTFGWAPFIALSILAFCFCTWEGAFLGIQIPNSRFKRFNKILEQGKHVFFIDLDEEQAQEFDSIVKWHPELKSAGGDIGLPRWFLRSSHNIREAIRALP